MLRRFRTKLRLIHYYSATREQTVWTQAMDVALILTLLLSFPITWALDAMAVRTSTAIVLTGQLFREEDRSITALLTQAETGRPVPTKAEPIGNFVIQVKDRSHGWPLTTTVRRLPAQVDIDLREEVRPRTNAQLAADDPLRLGIEDALRLDEQAEALAAWPPPEQVFGDHVDVRRQWLSWLIAPGVWWIVMMFSASMMIQVARLGWIIVSRKQHKRRAQLRAQGKCLSCGYDMTGLEFNERCPECGELVW